MPYFNDQSIQEDDALTAEYSDRVTIAERFLDAAAVAYAAYPTLFHRTRLVKAASAYSGAVGDAAFVEDTRRA